MKTKPVLKRNLAAIPPYVAGVYKKGALKLASNENPVGPSPRALKAIAREARRLNIYPESSYEYMREQLSRRIGIAKDRLIMGNGSDDIMLFAAAAYVDKGDNAITSRGTFSTYSFVTRLFAGSMQYAPMKNHTFNLDAIRKLVNRRTRIIFLCNPNSPTGTYFTQDEFIRFMNKVPESVLVVADEAYCQYATAPDFPRSLTLFRKYPNLLVLRTFSKLYGLAGLRIGIGMGQARVIADLNRARLPFNVNSLGQAAAIAAMDDRAFTRKILKINEQGKAYLYREFKKLGLVFLPTQSNFIFVELGFDCQRAFRRIMELGVTIRPLTSFGFNTAIRVTVGTMAQNKKFIGCLKNVLS